MVILSKAGICGKDILLVQSLQLPTGSFFEVKSILYYSSCNYQQGLFFQSKIHHYYYFLRIGTCGKKTLLGSSEGCRKRSRRK